MKDNLPTAEEFISHHYGKIYDKKPKSFKTLISKEKYIELNGLGKIDGIEKSNKDLLIEFAKLHVEAFREDLIKNVKIKEEYFSDEDTSLTLIKEMVEDGGYGRYDRYGEIYAVDIVSVDKDSILNAYPLIKIK